VGGALPRDPTSTGGLTAFPSKKMVCFQWSWPRAEEGALTPEKRVSNNQSSSAKFSDRKKIVERCPGASFFSGRGALSRNFQKGESRPGQRQNFLRKSFSRGDTVSILLWGGVFKGVVEVLRKLFQQ